MKSSPKRLGLLILAVLFASGALLAQNIPLNNWTVPPYTQSSSSHGGITTMTDITAPRAFIGVAPCRLVDTRQAGFPAGYGMPALVAGSPRNFALNSDPLCPGIPSVQAYSLNITVTNTQGPGVIKMWPQGGTVPDVSTLNYLAGQTIANAAIVPAGTGGGVTVVAGVSGTDLIIDINGYFSDTLGNPGNIFQIINNSPSQSIFAENDSTTCSSNCGITAEILSTNGAWAIAGLASGNTGVNYGVYGLTSSSTPGTAAVYGTAISGTSGETYGVHGHSTSSSTNGAGVNGDATNAVANGGRFINSGFVGSETFLATKISGVNYGIFAANSRLFGQSLVISGAPKTFAAPHPEDAGMEIRYASVEAPTVDVYFRGTAELANGIARIEVPDHFRFTAREGTYMTTLTPVGRSIALSVEAEGPEGIVVRGTGNARFHYVVYAERAEIEGFQPVIKNETFTPEALAKGNRLEATPPSTRALLVKNGTLNPDGSFNVETARAHGWTIPERQTSPPAPREP